MSVSNDKDVEKGIEIVDNEVFTSDSQWTKNNDKLSEQDRLLNTCDSSPTTISVRSNNINDDSNSKDCENNLVKSLSSYNGISIIQGHSQVSTKDGTGLRHRFSGRGGNSKFKRSRIVFKNGECNVHLTNISKRRRKYLADFFTTLLDLKWRYTLLIFAMGFLLSWTLFATIFWLIAFTHGDFDFEHLPQNQESSGWEPCVSNFYGFQSALLFSVESQTTIGYGFRYPTEECPETVWFVLLQNIMGVMLQSFLAGVIFTKLSRPKKRSETLLFSKNGVICQRDGQLCLMFRVGDMRKSHIIGASVRAQMIGRKTTQEGETMPYYQHELKVGVDSEQENIFFIWPMVVVHKIDKNSPLYSLSAADLMKEKFEIVLIFEGAIESTGSTTQARTSYLPNEILWGHRFESLVSYTKDVRSYSVDYSKFHSTYEIDTPLCSEKDLDEIRRIQKEMKRQGGRLLTPFRMSALSGGGLPHATGTATFSTSSQ